MLSKGYFVDEIGEVAGQYWFRAGQNAFHVRVLGVTRDGYTEEGVYELANRFGYQLFERDEWERMLAWEAAQ